MITAKPAKTLDDLRALPPETRAERLGGEIVMSPAPNSRHQTAVGNTYSPVKEFVEPRGLGRVFVAPLDVILPSGAVVEPDVLFVAAGRLSIVKDDVEGAPDLIVEVLSPSTAMRDRVVKRAQYERDGVAEYWLEDVLEKTVEVLALSGGRYVCHGVFGPGETVTSLVLPGLRITVDRIFG